MFFCNFLAFFDDPVNTGHLISGSSDFFLNQLEHLKVHGSRIAEAWLGEFLACEISAIVWYFEHSLALPFFGIGMKPDLFQSCGHC